MYTLYDDVKQYNRITDKLICLIVIGLDISFDVGFSSQFIHKSKDVYWEVILRILAYIKGSFWKGAIL